VTVDARQILPRTAPADEVLRFVLSELDRGARVAVATVVVRHGSAPSTPGQKLALSLDASGGEAIAVGTVGGGAIERVVVDALANAARGAASQPRIETFRLGPSLGMCCGGSAEILIEPMRPALALLLVGAGHIGLATAELAASLGFRVRLVDARPEATEPARTAALERAGVRVFAAEHDDPEVLEGFGAPSDGAALVVMTHDHQLDQRVVEWAFARGFAFVGGVGSRAKAERTLQRLAAKGVAESVASTLRMPVGVEIGARRPGEIAVAIVAELIAHRAGLEGLARRTGSVVASSAPLAARGTPRDAEALQPSPSTPSEAPGAGGPTEPNEETPLP
jgi:xanthine dehydrogenase accessory factor